jgi:cold shock CspA family protein
MPPFISRKDFIMKEIGTIKRFLPWRGFGFIQREHGEDVFFHIRRARIPEEQVHAGLQVQFEIVADDKYDRVSARNVELVESTVPQA